QHLYHLYLSFIYRSGAHCDLLSFPTRRSSDLRHMWEFILSLLELEPVQVGLSVVIVTIIGFLARQFWWARHVVGLGLEAYQYAEDRKSTRLNSSHVKISYAVFCLKKKT